MLMWKSRIDFTKITNKREVEYEVNFTVFKKYKLYLFFNILAVLGFAVAELGIPTIVSNMIDRGIVLKDKIYIYKLGIVILIVAIIGGIGNILLAYCSSKVSTSITRDIRNDIFKKLKNFLTENIINSVYLV